MRTVVCWSGISASRMLRKIMTRVNRFLWCWVERHKDAQSRTFRCFHVMPKVGWCVEYIPRPDLHRPHPRSGGKTWMPLPLRRSLGTFATLSPAKEVDIRYLGTFGPLVEAARVFWVYEREEFHAEDTNQEAMT